MAVWIPDGGLECDVVVLFTVINNGGRVDAAGIGTKRAASTLTYSTCLGFSKSRGRPSAFMRVAL